MRSQMHARMEACIDQLRAVEEMSVEEVSEALGVPEGLARDVDQAVADAFSFDGGRCDRIVAGVITELAQSA